MTELFKNAVKECFGCEMLSCEKIGGGGSGVVYKLTMDKAPFQIAAKTAKNGDLLRKETEYLNFISNLVDIKFPKIFYQSYNNDKSFIFMDFFDGKNCSDKFLLRAPKKIRVDVAEQIADNIIKLQKIKGEKYGDLLNPVYDSWHDYYRPFVEMVVKEAKVLEETGFINKKILHAANKCLELYDKIFDEPISQPTPTHGDYWAQNIIIDSNYKLIGVVDPFNCMWGDNEYELFALNAVYGKKLPVLEAFLKKEKVSNKFFLKISFYYLISEIYWVCKLHHNNVNFLMALRRKFNKQLKINNLK